ncbi:hypothetical protein [Shouchella miscanthi]|uniref:N-acetyltransferase n=1 Tax=Shouchella miscanthi TaxID=2598861 RepID=A0ABU6NIQ2_9BACI|nr:hypothetical protein [Shouchella miscanthi]
MSVIELTTNRLKLRLFQEKEAEHIAALCNNYAIYRSTLTMPYLAIFLNKLYKNLQVSK